MWAAVDTGWIVVWGGGSFASFHVCWKNQHSASPQSNLTEPRAHHVADDVVSTLDMPDWAGEGCGRRKWARTRAAMVAIIYLTSLKNGSDVEADFFIPSKCSGAQDNVGIFCRVRQLLLFM